MIPVARLQITDTEILNFALNLEYLEAEFYACASSGVGLPVSLRGGGPASIGCKEANLTAPIKVRPCFCIGGHQGGYSGSHKWPGCFGVI